MIRWVFLDVGNVLLDEDFLTFHVFRRHVEAIRQVRPDRSFLDLIAERTSLALGGSRWPVFELTSLYLGPEQVAATWDAVDREIREDFAAWNPVVSGALDMLDELGDRYHLGLIANQPRPCRDYLGSLGILDRFSAVALSEEEGVFKPDVELFQRALKRADASPSECVMVGDRFENDILPARSLGMESLRVEWPRREAKGWDGGGMEGKAYLASLTRLAGREASHASPSVETLADVARAVGRMENSSTAGVKRKLSIS